MILPASTTLILHALRYWMLRENITAYIIPAGDEHYTEFVAECHQRRPYVSGFTGSAGTAVVTIDTALLWTDGRYYFQAEQQLDNNWELMRDGTLGVPSQAQWLVGNLSANSRVGVDPALYTKSQWDSLENELKSGGISLVAVEENLVDKIWETRPNCSSNPVFNLDLQYSGKNTSEKVRDIRLAMAENNAAVLLVAELDEVAWLLNLRGRDIPSSSIFFGYVILTSTTFEFFVNPTQVPTQVETRLKENVPEIVLRPYGEVYAAFKETVDSNSGSVWVNRNANYKLVRFVENADRLLIKLTPISLMKAIKNTVEVEGYGRALLRDSAALCEFFAWLEAAMARGDLITEISASDHLYDIRKNRSNIFIEKSFTTISAIGVNGAVIHYMPTPETDTPLSNNEVYLLDSGAIYNDGTTDITRTIHFGTPTAFEKEAYTRVLKGQIALVTATFPDKTVGHRLDSFAREALWAVGLEYNHGTGHGIGHALNVHEGPFSIGSGYRAEDPGLQENMFTSNEPGYYDEVEKFGIRLENIIRVKKVELPNNFQDRGFLGFEDLTFVPYSHKMLDLSILTEEEIEYLNEYQRKARTLVGDHLRTNDFPEAAIDWLFKETVPIGESPVTEDPTSPPTEDPDKNSANLSNNGNWVLIPILLISSIFTLIR